VDVIWEAGQVVVEGEIFVESRVGWVHSTVRAQFKLYAWGERIADRVEFEETALKAVNTSFKPDAEKPEYDLGPLELKAQLFHPKTLKDPLDAWKTHLFVREPYHKRFVSVVIARQVC
jgi:hypothetical protein